jgi:hypothetical protein
MISISIISISRRILPEVVLSASLSFALLILDNDNQSKYSVVHFCTTLPSATGSGEYYILIVFIFFIECIPVLGRLEEVQREGDLLCFL